ncbi:hypothetical protein SAMN05444004_1261 [Jannaschia faecimaris]|uniref:Uncharacterized protein n=1 Tax=Jannaschia faecimaris TaxID=1244108 RepID=A0A1H3U8M0_9RHOB|nr:hypothetical protein SAMN05444004_1261 [Jannaschia faecimaris]
MNWYSAFLIKRADQFIGGGSRLIKAERSIAGLTKRDATLNLRMRAPGCCLFVDGSVFARVDLS